MRQTLKKFVFPRLMDNNASALAFPIGGIGTGTISLGSRGQLRDWEIFSRPSKGLSPKHCFAAIWVKPQNKNPQARIIEGCMVPPFEKARGLGRDNLPGLPRFRKTIFSSVYPFANIKFIQPDFPVDIELETFNPLIPLDTENSSLPVAVLKYKVINKHKIPVDCTIAYSLTNFLNQVPCTANKSHNNKSFSAVQLIYKDKTTGHNIDGTICLSTNGHKHNSLPNWDNSCDRDEAMAFWNYFSKCGTLPPAHEKFTAPTASVSSSFRLAASETKTISFYITWHFSRRTLGICGWNNWLSQPTDDKTNIGNFYAGKYKDAYDAACKIIPRIGKLEKLSRTFVDALRNSTLPPAVLDAANANISTIRTQTIFQTKDGKFHGFEGCNDDCGSCFGDCNHVYNYEQASSSLFPAIFKSFLETAFIQNTDKNGVNSFRTTLPSSKPRISKVAADGTMGTIMRLYHLWQITGESKILKRYWPVVKSILNFTWKQHSWDGNQDGVMEGIQHNTYDVEFYGPNPLCQVWYLGALKATTEMAKAMDDKHLMKKCSELFIKGSEWTDSKLFNGDYYRQIVQPLAPEFVDPIFESRGGARNRKQPFHQIENGCLIDQLVGQFYAHICRLGHLLKPINIKKTLKYILHNNFQNNLYDFESTQRIYALNDESGVVICSYPKGNCPEIPMPYINEIMTGFEYQLAIHLIFEGCIKQGIKIVESIRNRYDGIRRNQYNEAECGHHYVRAMASWALLPALAGFHWSGTKKSLVFNPKINQQNFNTFFVTPTFWGIYSQITSTNKYEFKIKVLYGKTTLNQLCLPSKGKAIKNIMLNDKVIKNVIRTETGFEFRKLQLKVNDVIYIR
ncbi:MAG: hypothetical protein A2Y12_15690 [Planctomycetes bacterium GWF2_42_9]|nr:MAG: hypothetical protein A2Y12_15690 [Planctomycetes bacterium GWF2_42_9]